LDFAVPRTLIAHIRPHCLFVFLRSCLCYALLSAWPRGVHLAFRYSCRHSVWSSISDDWFWPMPGTLGAALAAKNPTRCMAPAAPVFAAKAAPTGPLLNQRVMCCSMRAHPALWAALSRRKQSLRARYSPCGSGLARGKGCLRSYTAKHATRCMAPAAPVFAAKAAPTGALLNQRVMRCSMRAHPALWAALSRRKQSPEAHRIPCGVYPRRRHWSFLPGVAAANLLHETQRH